MDSTYTGIDVCEANEINGGEVTDNEDSNTDNLEYTGVTKLAMSFVDVVEADGEITDVGSKFTVTV